MLYFHDSLIRLVDWYHGASTTLWTRLWTRLKKWSPLPWGHSLPWTDLAHRPLKDLMPLIVHATLQIWNAYIDRACSPLGWAPPVSIIWDCLFSPRWPQIPISYAGTDREAQLKWINWGHLEDCPLHCLSDGKMSLTLVVSGKKSLLTLVVRMPPLQAVKKVIGVILLDGRSSSHSSGNP